MFDILPEGDLVPTDASHSDYIVYFQLHVPCHFENIHSKPEGNGNLIQRDFQ